jgi:hypothetical protein
MKVATLVVAITLIASANPINPGFDFFVTPASAGTQVDLGSLGIVDLEGVPLPGLPFGIDTVVARKQPGPPEGATNQIDIELVALHLTSISPIDLGGGNFADLHITIDNSESFYTGTAPKPDGTGTGPSFFDLPIPVPVAPSTGKMEIQHDGPGPHAGGTMRACLGDPAGCDPTGPLFGQGLGAPGGGVHSNAILVVPGGDPANPADVLQELEAPTITLASQGVWNHVPYAITGGFALISIVHTGPHPAIIRPYVPEPSSALLALVGSTGLLGYVRRRRQS